MQHDTAVGRSPPRRDGVGKVTGAARYVDDLPEGTQRGNRALWTGATVRSTVPCGALDPDTPTKLRAAFDAWWAGAGASAGAGAGCAADGAGDGLQESGGARTAVLVTAADLPGSGTLALITDDWPVLAHDRVNHEAEPIALVAAPDAVTARALAAHLSRVAGECVHPETPVSTLAEALAKQQQHPESVPVLAKCDVNHGDVDAAFAAATQQSGGVVVVEGTYSTGHQEHLYIEPQGMVAEPMLAEELASAGEGADEAGRSTGADSKNSAAEGFHVWGSMQCPYYIHRALTQLLSLPDHLVRVSQTTTGGGFGGKEDFPSMLAAHAVLLARACGQGVKIIYDREQDIVSTTKRHPSQVWHRIAVDADGTLLAMDIRVDLDGGAYTTLSPVVLSRAVLHAAGPYRCPNVRIRGQAVVTHTPPNGAFRGFGAPQSQFATERHMDRVGRVLGIDPLTLRRRNAYRQGDVTATGQVLDKSVSALACLDLAAQRTDFAARWQQAEHARQQPSGGGGGAQAATTAEAPTSQGVGIALVWHGTGFTGNGEDHIQARAALRLCAGGVVEVLAASTDIGQGTQTVFAQLVADGAGIPLAQVRVVPPDTWVVPDSGPTVASRTVMIVGGLLTSAAARLANQLREFWQRESSQDVFDFATAADAYLAAHDSLHLQTRFEPLTKVPFDDSTYRGDAYPAYGWAANVAVVEVDTDTLEVTAQRLTAVVDVGRAVHPVLCAGQVEGGVAQAVGWGLQEDVQVQDGRFLNRRLTNTIIPTAMDTPKLDVVLLENPAASGPLYSTFSTSAAFWSGSTATLGLLPDLGSRSTAKINTVAVAGCC